MLRRGLTVFLIVTVVMTYIRPASAAAADAEQQRPNILWLIGEDLGPELGCYGTPEAETPNLDRLAKQGVRYTRAFTVTPVCSSSRSALMTGMYATSIDAQHHRSHRNDGYTLPEGVRVLTDWLRPAGYFTANVRHFPDSAGFRGTGKTDWNFNYEGRAGEKGPFDTDRWSDLKEHQPFYAQVNFPETHRDFHGPERADPDKVEIPPYYPDHPLVRKDWARYLDTLMVLDEKIGTILELLERDGLAENTIVVFLGDHGRAMVRGKQWPYDSGLHIPLLIRWPENFEPPKHFEAGTVDGRLIQSIDVSATTLWAAGVEPPMLMQGRVFLGERADRFPPRKYAFAARGRGDETQFRIRTVRSKRYRYIRNYHPERPFMLLNEYKERQYPVMDLLRKLHFEGKLTPVQEKLLAPSRPAEELYDLKSDPWETNNLIDSKKPEHRRALIELRAALETWMYETNDQGRFPEDPEVVKRWKQSDARRFRNWGEKHPEKYERIQKLRREWQRKRDEQSP